MTKLSKVTKVLTVLMIIAAMTAAVQAEEVSLKILAPWEAAGHVFKVGPEKLQFIGTFQGIMYIENAQDELDAALFICPATQEINTVNRETIAHGRCMITEGEEDFVYAEFTCKGVVGACNGKFNITDGEGQFKGIKGSSDMMIRSALGAMAVDLKSGSVVQAAEGLAVWPNLKYTLPAK